MGIIMRRIFRIIEGFIRYWWVVALTVIVLCLVGCKTKHITSESVKTDTQYIDRFHRDSIFIRDSVYIREKGDTIWLTKWRTEYRDRFIHDTIYITKTDSINTIVEVVKEKQLNWWQRFKLDAAGWIIATMIVAILLYILYRKLKK